MAGVLTKGLSGADNIDSLLNSGYCWGPANSLGVTIITINFVGDPLATEPDATKFWEDDAFFRGVVAYERVANVDFVHVDSSIASSANIRIKTGTPQDYSVLEPDPEHPDDVVLGYQTGPYSSQSGAQAKGYYNTQARSWTEAGTQKGGDGFWTIIHEMGHSLGLKHPFDEGESGNFSLLAKRFDDMIFTVMSYESGGLGADGWYNSAGKPTHGPASLTSGFVAGPGVFDIAAAQYLYGANTNRADFDLNGSPNDTLVLPGSNKAGTYWTTVWDTAGIDEITYAGAEDCRISLIAFDCAGGSTKKAQVPGTIISQVNGVNGGVIIADDFTNAIKNEQGVSGVIIENAAAGSGDDSIWGNSADNRLDGYLGADWIYGGGGADKIYLGKDHVSDKVRYTAIRDSGNIPAKSDQIFQFDSANSNGDATSDKIDLSFIDADPAKGNQAFRFVKAFSTPTGNQSDGEVMVLDTGSGFAVYIDLDGNKKTDMMIELFDVAKLTASDFIL